MSGLLDQAGLTAGSGLSNGAGLYKWGNFKPFDPTDLDPFLLFDTGAGSMIGTLENPTLDLDPSNPDSLDVITATRAGIATYTDSSGLIKAAPIDTVRVDYTQGAELTPTKFQNIGYTDFSSGWPTYLGTTALGNGYDGQASLVCSFTGSGQSYQYFQSVDGVTYTGSFWARAVSGSGPFRLIHGNSASGSSTYINLTSEWQFFSAQFLGRSGGGTMYFGIGAGSGDSVEISQPQVEEGTTASDFVENTTGSPKFISSAVYSDRVPMVLIEPSAINLVPYSENFNDVNGSTKTTGIDAPDGSNNAERFSGGASINDVFANSKTASIATGSAVDYVGSIYVRGTAGETVTVFMKRAGAGPNVSSGSLSVLLTGQWQRVENLSLTTDPANDGLRIFISSSSETADSVDLWGSQIETGSVSTSVIPTSGGNTAARTRAADDLVISGSAFSSFFNTGGDGTFFVTAQIKNPEGQHATLRGGSNSQLYVYSNADAQHFAYDGGSNVNSYGDVTENQLTNFAVSYNSSNFTVSKDGSSDSSLSTTGNLSNATRLEIGTGYSTGFCGHFRRIIYWPYSSDRL